MANCPKCGRKLTLFDWKPNCPECGVNLVYYGLEDKLLDEADAAEAEHARLQKRIDRLKAAFIGSKLTIARIFLSLLPIAALLIPLCEISFKAPFMGDKTTAVNLIELVNVFSGLDFDALFAMLGSATLSTMFIGYAGALVTLALSLVFVIVSLVALMAACGPKGNVRNFILNGFAIAFAVASIVFFSVFASNGSAVFGGYLSGKIGAGIFVYIGMLLVLLAVNIVLAVKGTPVKYKQCFVGGIPAEEYFELVEKGTPKEEIREMMNKALDAIEAKKNSEADAAAEKKETAEAK